MRGSGAISLKKHSIGIGSADAANSVGNCVKNVGSSARHKILVDFITDAIEGGKDECEQKPPSGSAARVYLSEGSEKQSP